MMRAALITDFLGYSGGDFVNIVITKALISQGYYVDIYTASPEKLLNAYHAFQERIPKRVSIKNVKISPPSPYFTWFVLHKIKRSNERYNIIVFNDDIPKNIKNFQSALVVTYIHFPHAARVKYGSLVEKKYTEILTENLKWNIHRHLFPFFFYVNETPSKPGMIIANSTLTYHCLKKLWPGVNVKILYPPVQVKKITRSIKSWKLKKNQVIYLGRVMPDKGIEDLITALSNFPDVRAKILGPIIDQRYLHNLLKQAKKLGVQEKVKFAGLISRNEVIKSLVESKVLIHPAPNEPFGIAVVEGMAAGCIPIIKRGLNGPWIDILKRREKYGYSYTTPEELHEKLKMAFYDARSLSQAKEAVNYVLQFDEEVFVTKFCSLTGIC